MPIQAPEVTVTAEVTRASDTAPVDLTGLGVRLRHRTVMPTERTLSPDRAHFLFVRPQARSTLYEELARRGWRRLARVTRTLDIIAPIPLTASRTEQADSEPSVARAPEVQLSSLRGAIGATPVRAEDRVFADVQPGMRVDVVRVRPDGRITMDIVDPVTSEALQALAHDLSVLAVERTHNAQTTLHWSRRQVGADAVQQFSIVDGLPRYDGIIGRGVRVALTDTGVGLEHPDFFRYDETGEVIGSRVVGTPPIDGDQHGTSVAGALAGSGHASEGQSAGGVVATPFMWRGVAPGVEEICSIALGRTLEHPLVLAFIEHQAYVANHSHTLSAGNYTSRISVFDDMVRLGALNADIEAPPRPVVFAAANNGRRGNSFSPLAGFYSILAPPKNTITVGGTFANEDFYSWSSSMGPTLDGRLKPDLVAPGYKDYRPPGGVLAELFEVRIHAREDSGAEDIVWTAGDTSDEWEFDGSYAEGEVVDGALRFRSAGDGGFNFVPNEGIPAESYDRATVQMRLTTGADGDRYLWPSFWVLRYHRGDRRNDRFPPFAEEVRLDGVIQDHEQSFVGDESWTGTIDRIRFEPIIYDSRVHAPALPDRYSIYGGTSIAAPVVTGAIAILMEHFTNLHAVDWDDEPLWPSTLRAWLVHTARDLIRTEADSDIRTNSSPDTGEPVLYGPGPDWATGYGVLDIPTAVDLVDAHSDATRYREETISEGATHIYRFPVDEAGGSLRITLVWDDPPGSSLLGPTENQIVHDLDLVAIAPDSIAHSPWVLDLPPLGEDPFAGQDPITTEDVTDARRCQSPSYWTQDTVDCENHRDNIEQVLVDDPEGGFWEVRVRAPELSEGDQNYSLIVTQQCD